MDDKLIQWPKAVYWDKAWNPVIGCNKCSPACDNCYAKAWADRFGRSFKPQMSCSRIPPKKGVVFCGNLTDLFGEFMWPWNGFDDDIFITDSSEDLISRCNGKKATYLWLTKRMANMVLALTGSAHFLDEEGDGYFVPVRNINLSNHYFGFTAENQKWYDSRVLKMGQWPIWANAWVSCEPLLGNIYLDVESIPKYKWVVVGCESGPKRRPCKIEWVESIVNECMSANVPVFVKQLDIDGKCVTDINKFPERLRIRQVPWKKGNVLYEK